MKDSVYTTQDCEIYPSIHLYVSNTNQIKIIYLLDLF